MIAVAVGVGFQKQPDGDDIRNKKNQRAQPQMRPSESELATVSGGVCYSVTLRFDLDLIDCSYIGMFVVDDRLAYALLGNRTGSGPGKGT